MANKINSSDFFHQILTDDEVSQIKQMIDLFKKENNREFEVSFQGIDYQNYMRVVEYYINLVQEDKISQSNTLDISIISTLR